MSSSFPRLPRLLALLAAALILAALAYGIRVRVVGDAPAGDRGVVVVHASASTPATAPSSVSLVRPVAPPSLAPALSAAPSATDQPSAAVDATPTVAGKIEQLEAEARARSRRQMIERAAARGMPLRGPWVD